MITKCRPILLLTMLLLAACATGTEPLAADYEQALTLARSGQCDQATPLFQTVYENGAETIRDGDTETLTTLAGRGQTACANLALAEQQQLYDPARALEALNNSAYFFQASPQQTAVQQLYATLWENNSAEILTTPTTCRQWTAAAPNLPDPAENVPQFLQACGNMLGVMLSGSSEARDYYRSVLTNYPDASNRGSVEQALAFETIAYINSAPDTVMPLAQPDPISGAAIISSDVTQLAIANRSSSTLNVVIAGFNTVVTSVAGCDDCEVSTACENGEPSQIFSLAPGPYQIIIEPDGAADGSAAAPSAGNWDLEAGVSYSVCYVAESAE